MYDDAQQLPSARTGVGLDVETIRRRCTIKLLISMHNKAIDCNSIPGDHSIEDLRTT